MEGLDIVYIIDYVNCTVIEKINLEYLDISSRPTAVSNRRISQVQKLKDEYLYVLKKYHIDSPSSTLKLQIEGIDFYLLPYEKEMITEKKPVWCFYSRGDFFYEIQHVVSKSSFKIFDLIKYLKAIKKSNFVLCESFTDDCMYCLDYFLNIIVQSVLDPCSFIELVVQVLIVFSMSELIVEKILDIAPEKFAYLMECSRHKQFNFCGIWQSNELSSLSLCFTLTQKNYDNFIFLLKLGAENVYSIDAYELLSFELEYLLEMQEADPYLKNIYPSRRNFLILQVVVLFSQSRIYTASTMPAKALVALWNSMQDPYLAEADFIKFYSVCSETYKTILQNCWIWYYENIYLRKSFEICGITRNVCVCLMNPRSLKYLASYTIRRHLAKNFFITADINWRGIIPRQLQEYLGSNLVRFDPSNV